METLTALANWLARAGDLIVSHDPWVSGLVGLAVGLAICPGYMYLLAVVSEWRWPRYNEQFRAFMPGNLYLSVIFGAVAYLAAAYRVSGTQVPLFEGRLWVWIPFVVAGLLVLALSVVDILPAFSYKPGDTNKYHWRQLISWTKVWHNVAVYGAYGFLLIRLGVPGMVSAPLDAGTGGINNLLRVVVLVALIRWATYLAADAKNPKHSTGHVRVNFGQWLVGLVVVSATCVGLAYAI